ncbi:MAG TPA: hypothetical protein DCS93_15710 [Microscillaceae bacterium]|nr:hypothetical protein [Microscillaceae bacterium]
MKDTDHNKEILIIGGGIAGLSTGIYAQKNGYQATILEMHDKPGGQLTAWVRDGYRFDYCLHWLVGTDHGTFNDIWWETGALDEDTIVVNHNTRIKIKDEEHGDFFIYNDLDEWEAYLIAMAPEDEASIRKLCQMMRDSDKLDQFEDAPGLRGISDYFSQVVSAGTFLLTLFKYGKKTTRQLVEHLGFKSEKLLNFFHTFFGGQDFSAMGFLMMLGWAHAKNAGYLQGGSFEMAQRMERKFQKLGGKFQFNHKVVEIIVENGRATGVKLIDGTILKADYIISACDGHTVLYEMLKGQYLPAQIKEAYNTWPMFSPIVMVGFGINDQIISECHSMAYIRKDIRMVGRTPVKEYNIWNRSMYDDVFAPAGKTTILLQFESPWELWEHLEGTEYMDEKEAIRKAAIALLEEQYPGISAKIETMDVATPRTIVKYTGVYKGAYEGFLPSTDVLNGLPMELDGLENFMMVGQWLFPGGGLPPSAQSGKWAIQKLVNQEHKDFVVM